MSIVNCIMCGSPKEKLGECAMCRKRVEELHAGERCIECMMLAGSHMSTCRLRPAGCNVCGAKEGDYHKLECNAVPHNSVESEKLEAVWEARVAANLAGTHDTFIIPSHPTVSAYEPFQVTYVLGFFYIDRFGGKMGPFKSYKEASERAEKGKASV